MYCLCQTNVDTDIEYIIGPGFFCNELSFCERLIEICKKDQTVGKYIIAGDIEKVKTDTDLPSGKYLIFDKDNKHAQLVEKYDDKYPWYLYSKTYQNIKILICWKLMPYIINPVAQYTSCEYDTNATQIESQIQIMTISDEHIHTHDSATNIIYIKKIQIKSMRRNPFIYICGNPYSGKLNLVCSLIQEMIENDYNHDIVIISPTEANKKFYLNKFQFFFLIFLPYQI